MSFAMAAKNVLIVFAHQERKSLNGAILDLTVETLKSKGLNVSVSDLHVMDFNPVMSRKDFKGNQKHPDKFNWLAEMIQAQLEDRVSDDIRIEQSKVKAADLIIFQFPLYWMGFPAILKGWFDRVMNPCYKFGFDHKRFRRQRMLDHFSGGISRFPASPRMLDFGHFAGKLAMLSFTTGGREQSYSHKGLLGDINVTLWPLQNGTLRYLGYDILAPHIVYGTINLKSVEDVDEILLRWRHRLESIFEERTLFFYDASDFEDDVSKEEVASRVKGPFGPTTGQHCGMILPPTSQVKAQQ